MKIIGVSLLFITLMALAGASPKATNTELVHSGQTIKAERSNATETEKDNSLKTNASSFSNYPSNAEHPAGGGGSGSSPSQTISKYDLSENRIDSFNTYEDLKKGESFKSDEWRENMLSHFMTIKIDSISRVTGIYSHFTPYFNHSALESGSFSEKISQKISYSDTLTESLSFTTSMDFHVEYALEEKANIDNLVSADDKEIIKSGATFNYDCIYTRSKTREYSLSEDFEISTKDAYYCPNGYGLALGQEGTYYVFEGSYQEYTIWWWGTYETQGTTTHKFKALLANPNNMIYCFAYKLLEDTNTDYYYIK